MLGGLPAVVILRSLLNPLKRLVVWLRICKTTAEGYPDYARLCPVWVLIGIILALLISAWLL